MAFYAAPLENLIERLCGLPGIGPKSAQRMAFFILSIPRDDAVELARAIVEVKDKVRFCSTCFNISEGEACSICNDARRDETVICVVEEPRDVIAIERSGRFRGTYHVLGGAISPIDGVGPEELTFRELVGRLRDGKVTELVRPLGITVTRIARGLPVGGDLEYADEVTLGRALDGRSEM